MGVEKFYCVCVEDDTDILDSYTKIVTSLDFEPKLFSDPLEAKQFIITNEKRIALVLSDLKMPNLDGPSLRKAMLPELKSIPFVLISGFISKDLALQSIDLGISALLNKPCPRQEISDTLRKASQERVTYLQEKAMIEDIFIQESTSTVEELQTQLLRLENEPHNEDLVNSIFRAVHTIKGSSASVQCHHMAQFSHHFEDLLSQVKRQEIEVTPEIVSVLLQGLDILKDMLGCFKSRQNKEFQVPSLILMFENVPKVPRNPNNHNTQTTAVKANIPSKILEQDVDTVKVSTLLLDEFMEMSGEITLLRNMIKKLLKSIEKQSAGIKEIAQLADMLEEMHKINNKIQGKVVEMRKVPLKNYCMNIPRAVRDLCLNLKKKVNFDFEGEDLKIDHSLSHVVSDSLLHIVRNSLDHGIELPADRKKSGKSESGLLKIRAKEDRAEVIIDIIDDGNGLDGKKIMNKAVERGIVTLEQASKLSETQIQNFIFMPGFSTAEKVTDVSGRGVGMDMVRTSVERARGRIEVNSKVGKGTNISLRLPIPKSVLIISGLLVECSGQTFAIPHDHIIYVSQLNASKQKQCILPMEGGRIMLFNDKYIPLVDLAEVLQLPTVSKSHEDLCVVVVKSENLVYGVVIDSIIDGEDIVVKPLSKHLSHLQAYNGSTFLGEGEICMILDLRGIAQMKNISDGLIPSSSSGSNSQLPLKENQPGKQLQEVVTFSISGGLKFAIPQEQVYRLEEFNEKKIQVAHGQVVTYYRSTLMPLVALDEVLGLSPTGNFFQNTKTALKHSRTILQPAIIVTINGKLFGLNVEQISDISHLEEAPDRSLAQSPFDLGIALVEGKTHTLIDLEEILKSCYKNEFLTSNKETETVPQNSSATAAESDGIFWVA